MNHQEGFRANLTTAILVGVGANLGLPMSTTHVATGAIAGLARGDIARLNRRTLRDFSVAWTVTPLSAGLVSALVFRMLS
jgi:PiT family inorganic phosphate transporter